MAELATASEAAKALRVSKAFLYHLPPSTPGVHKFGRAKRFDVERLAEWARRCATGQSDERGAR